MPTIGQRIREARVSRGMTQQDLAENLVTPSMISQIESDKARPSHSLLRQLVMRLGLDMNDFTHDMDDQYAVQSVLNLAHICLLTDRIDEAREHLDSMEPPTTPGALTNEFHRLQAILYRKSGLLDQAAEKIEELRESAYRTQDSALLMQIYRESGYIEYAMKNWQGAMLEWENAVREGETLVLEQGGTTTETRKELMEVYLALGEVHAALNHPEDAAEWFGKARTYSGDILLLTDLAQHYMEEAQTMLAAHPPTAARLTDRALHIVETARQLEQAIGIRDKQTEGDLDAADPWVGSAIATAGSNLRWFLEAEAAYIPVLIERGDHATASRRIQQCRNLTQLPGVATGESVQWLQESVCRLDILEAELAYSKGNQAEAMRLAEEVLQRIGHLDTPNTHRVYGRLIEWATAAGDVDRIQALLGRLEIWLNDKSPA